MIGLSSTVSYPRVDKCLRKNLVPFTDEARMEFLHFIEQLQKQTSEFIFCIYPIFKILFLIRIIQMHGKLAGFNHNGSFTPKPNLQSTGFRLASNSLPTGKMQLGYIGITWFHSHQFWNQRPVWSQSAAILIWCERALRKKLYPTNQVDFDWYIPLPNSSFAQ